jgi:hypothetical protein
VDRVVHDMAIDPELVCNLFRGPLLELHRIKNCERARAHAVTNIIEQLGKHRAVVSPVRLIVPSFYVFGDNTRSEDHLARIAFSCSF